MKRYEHTQFGRVIIAAIIGAMVLLFVLGAVVSDDRSAVIIVLATNLFLSVLLILFSSLTVTIDEKELRLRFGPGLFGKRFKLGDMQSCQAGKTSWYWGWGMRFTNRGPLYNVSGLRSVEVKLRNGKMFRVGTDVPEELEAALRKAIGQP